MLKQSNLTLLSYAILCVILFMTSCKDNTKKSALEKKPKPILNINFFLETSASMEGYMQGNTEFSDFITSLLVDIENRIEFKNKPIKIKYISDTITEYSKTTRDFIKDISTIKVAKDKSSEMHNIFEMVTTKTDSNDVSLFVSDCILSYSDSDIETNQEINLEKTGVLKAYMKDAFLKIKKKNICASVYGFNSKFKGTYYTYQNGKIPLNGEIRPYYIWVIGDKELVQTFNKQLYDIESFKPFLTMDFGMFDKPIQEYNLLFKTERLGSWAADNKNIKDIEISKSKPVRFAITVDFSSLPNYAKDIEYLKNNLRNNPIDCISKIVAVKNATEIDMAKAAPHEKEFLQHATHVIIIEVADMYKSEGSLKLYLPLKYDTSYLNYSTMDDKNKTSLTGKTFAFKYLIDGVREAYQNNNDNFVNISMTLKK